MIDLILQLRRETVQKYDTNQDLSRVWSPPKACWSRFAGKQHIICVNLPTSTGQIGPAANNLVSHQFEVRSWVLICKVIWNFQSSAKLPAQYSGRIKLFHRPPKSWKHGIWGRISFLSPTDTSSSRPSRGRKFRAKNAYYPKKELAYRMCTRPPTGSICWCCGGG